MSRLEKASLFWGLLASIVAVITFLLEFLTLIKDYFSLNKSHDTLSSSETIPKSNIIANDEYIKDFWSNRISMIKEKYKVSDVEVKSHISYDNDGEYSGRVIASIHTLMGFRSQNGKSNSVNVFAKRAAYDKEQSKYDALQKTLEKIMYNLEESK